MDGGAIAATCSLIFALDRVTGAAPVQHLYYLPIIFAAVRFGGGGGLSAALLSIVFYHLANSIGWTLHYQESDILQMAVFVAVGVTAGRLVNDSRRFRQLAMTDDLTGLHNLRSFETRLKSMVLAAREKAAPLSLLVLDLDNLEIAQRRPRTPRRRGSRPGGRPNPGGVPSARSGGVPLRRRRVRHCAPESEPGRGHWYRRRSVWRGQWSRTDPCRRLLSSGDALNQRGRGVPHVRAAGGVRPGL